jgi:DNA-binding XRE family transcriptional regulator
MGANIVMKRKIGFKDYIRSVGQDNLAKTLGVSPSTVGHWLTGHCLPSDEMKRQIVKLSKGAVTYQCIIDGGTL